MSHNSRKVITCNKFTVQVLEGTYDHASVEPVTTHILLLANLNKITNVYVELSKTTVGPNLPYVTVDGVRLWNSSMVKVLEQLGKMNMTLTDTEMRKMTFYRERIQKELEPAVLLHIWHSKDNRDFAINLRTHAMKHPFKFIQRLYLKWYTFNSIDRSETIFPKAIVLLETLETLLRKKTFFLSKLSYMDIHVVAYLYHVVMVDYPDATFKNLVKKHAPILFAYVERFAYRYDNSHYSSFYANVTHRFGTRSLQPDTRRQRIFRVTALFTASLVATAVISIFAMNLFTRFSSRPRDN